jgi:HK97 family phage major capsid protein
MERQIGVTYEVAGTRLKRILSAEGQKAIKVLRQCAADLAVEHEALIQGAVKEGRPYSATENGLMDAIEAELHRVKGEITAHASGNALASMGPSLDPRVDAQEERAARALPPVPQRTRAVIDQLFPDLAGTSAAKVSENFRAVVAAALGGQPMHAVIRAATATEGVPIDGGFAVMPDVAREMLKRAIEESVWLRIGARLEPMTSEEKLVVALDDDDESVDQEANLKANWKAEGAAATPQLMKIRQVRLRANKLMVLAATSSELSEDAGAGYLVELEEALFRAMGKKFDRAVFSGSGAGAPLGLLNAPATVTVSKTAGGDPGTAGTFTWVHATEMWARLAPGSHERAWWLIHPTVLPQALRMSLSIGTGGAIPAAAFHAGGPTGYQLLGRPVVVTSRCKQLSTAGDVMLADPSQVIVGIRRQMTVDNSHHLYYDTDRIAFRGTFRGDAQPAWDAPRTLVEGSTTVSPYVILQSR